MQKFIAIYCISLRSSQLVTFCNTLNLFNRYGNILQLEGLTMYYADPSFLTNYVENRNILTNYNTYI